MGRLRPTATRRVALSLDGRVAVTDWLLTAQARGNDATELDRRHADGLAWSGGNEVTPLVHGGSYFPELLR